MVECFSTSVYGLDFAASRKSGSSLMLSTSCMVWCLISSVGGLDSGASKTATGGFIVNVPSSQRVKVKGTGAVSECPMLPPVFARKSQPVLAEL